MWGGGRLNKSTQFSLQTCSPHGATQKPSSPRTEPGSKPGTLALGFSLPGSAHVPLHHRVREQRAGPKHAISVDHEAAAAVAVDVRRVRGLALQQRDARPLIQLVIRGREPMPTPWGPAEGYG